MTTSALAVFAADTHAVLALYVDEDGSPRRFGETLARALREWWYQNPEPELHHIVDAAVRVYESAWVWKTEFNNREPCHTCGSIIWGSLNQVQLIPLNGARDVVEEVAYQYVVRFDEDGTPTVEVHQTEKGAVEGEPAKVKTLFKARVDEYQRKRERSGY